mmetsp:Transcript_60440/g.197822  ORF Transcript_60440/g.197822 Transcript_60440/m.197822 type:complete len:107 (-) Transcript_60440:53-373(-)
MRSSPRCLRRRRSARRPAPMAATKTAGLRSAESPPGAAEAEVNLGRQLAGGHCDLAVSSPMLQLLLPDLGLLCYIGACLVTPSLLTACAVAARLRWRPRDEVGCRA